MGLRPSGYDPTSRVQPSRWPMKFTLLAKHYGTEKDLPKDHRGLGGLARSMNDPTGNVWALQLEFDVVSKKGDITDGDYKTQYQLDIQPILPIPLTKGWTLRSRCPKRLNTGQIQFSGRSAPVNPSGCLGRRVLSPATWSPKTCAAPVATWWQQDELENAIGNRS